MMLWKNRLNLIKYFGIGCNLEYFSLKINNIVVILNAFPSDNKYSISKVDRVLNMRENAELNVKHIKMDRTYQDLA